MFKVGDVIEVSDLHYYFYRMNTTFTYLGVQSGLHVIQSDTSKKVYSNLLLETMLQYFKLKEPVCLENK